MSAPPTGRVSVSSKSGIGAQPLAKRWVDQVRMNLGFDHAGPSSS